MVTTVSYPVAPRGLATSFAEAETPVEYALSFRNRYISQSGGAEKRQGIVRLGSTIAGTPTITGIHELVAKDGTETLFVSGSGVVYKFNGTTTYTSVYTFTTTSANVQSVQMGDKLIFWNGVDRSVCTTDGSTFRELQAVIEKGAATSGSTKTLLRDSGVTNWLLTNVAVNDIVYNVSKGAYAVVTVVASTSVEHTTIGTAATGIGVSTVGNQVPTDQYKILDAVELNIIPTDDPSNPDNVAVLTSGAAATSVRVSGVNFAATDVRVGDWVYNSTRAALTAVVTATSNLVVTSVAGQVAGDSVVFLKSAQPIASHLHVHYKRLYAVDARDKTKIRISGYLDPEDMTNAAGTLDAISVDSGGLQPRGDTLQALTSFQRFLVVHGKAYTYMFEGVDPIATTASSQTDFSVVGMFPHGLVSQRGTVTLGNDVAFVTPDGVQSVGLVNDSSTLNRGNISEALRNTLRTEIADTPENQIIALHYQRRAWLMVKVGTNLYVYNYAMSAARSGGQNQQQKGNLNPTGGSWSLFDGKFAEQNAFFVRRDGTLLCAGQGGKVYEFDQGTYDDDGDSIPTEYQTGWLSMDEPSRSVNIKDGRYIQPVILAAGDVAYTIRVEGGYQVDSSDTVTVTAPGTFQVGEAIIGISQIGGGISNIKIPLRWRGDVARFTFNTDNMIGPDVISRFAVYVHKRGKR